MLLLVCIAGIVIGLLHRPRAEKPIMVMIASLAALALVSLAGFVVEPVIYRVFGSGPSGGLTVSNLLAVWHGLVGLVQAAATAGLIFAVLSDRGFNILKFS